MSCEICQETIDDDEREKAETVCGCILCSECFEYHEMKHGICPECGSTLKEKSSLPYDVAVIEEIAEAQKQKLAKLSDELAKKEFSPEVSELLNEISASNKTIKDNLRSLKRELEEKLDYDM